MSEDNRNVTETENSESKKSVKEMLGSAKEKADAVKDKANTAKKKAIMIGRLIKKNRRVQIFLVVVLILLIVLLSLVVKGVKTIKYHGTEEYKLLSKGYTEDEVKVILTMTDEQKRFLLSHEYNESLDDFVRAPYFMLSKLDSYLTYKKAYPTTPYSTIVAYVNTNRDREFYVDTVETDVSKGELMMVNKYYLLPASYEPADLQSVPATYAYDGVKLSKIALDAFVNLCVDAKKAGYTIVASGRNGYRTNEKQSELWNDWKDEKGIDYADQVAARPGASDHQTGFALNVVDFDDNLTSFDKTGAYKWMKAHAHEYGFIQRYPNGKSEITGFAFEPGHYRYVGVEVATAIHELDITFEEYYAFYIEGAIK
ncbi:MAG: M15 family metallopeptidase [Clostridia bacterium]|nr:M15 family metallopeptidase [Clostridia bacterium]